MAQHFFITGTDTDVGKTFVTQAMLRVFAGAGLRALGYKPVSAGCEQTHEGPRNEDALLLQKYSNPSLSYDEVNPVAFMPPIAPHIAAKQAGINIDMDSLVSGHQRLLDKDPDVILTEGAGGWRLPLNEQGCYLSELPVLTKQKVILVVGLKLGCLNHALLTVEAIKADGLELAGWVANQVEEGMLNRDENIAALKSLIDAPCLGVIPRVISPFECDQYLSLISILKGD